MVICRYICYNVAHIKYKNKFLNNIQPIYDIGTYIQNRLKTTMLPNYICAYKLTTLYFTNIP